MRLSLSNYNSYDATFNDGSIGYIYSYESGNAIYDIAVVNGGKLYRTNGSVWSNLINSIKPIHCEIERHFNI